MLRERSPQIIVLVLVGVIAGCVPCRASDNSPDVLSTFLRGTVHSKANSQPLEDALVVLAERITENDRYRYTEITSVVTDSRGDFLFADPQLWERKRNLVLLAWKRPFSWQSYEIPARFYSASTREPVQMYLAPLYLDQGTCPTCRVVTPPSHPIKVFYATDREPGAQSPLTFLNRRDPKGQLHYGFCDAGVEELSSEDPVAVDKGFVNGLQPYSSANDLFSSILQDLPLKERPMNDRPLQDRPMQDRPMQDRPLKDLPMKDRPASVMVFIHGYQNSFAAACSAAAQVAYDTRFDGAVLIFSWPSRDEVSGYFSDEDEVRLSSPHLKGFLVALSSAVDLPVHMLAHSMGNRALLSAITASAGSPAPQLHLGEVVFAAADVDSDDFRNQMSPGINALRATLYASSHDMALAASKVFHLGKRAGDANPKIDVMPHLDSIDASLVDTSLLGHSYYRTSWSVLWDLRPLIQTNMSPDRRYGLIAGGGGTYWIISPR